MKEIIDALPTATRADYLLDTCFLIHMLEKGKEKELEKFCMKRKVGMTSFNLLELEHVIHNLPGPISRHIREFLKRKITYAVFIGVNPGDRDGERRFVQSFDPKIMEIIKDPSDAVMFVTALKIRADILTRDRHHVFTAAADNYSDQYQVKVLNKLPDQATKKQ